MTTKRRTPSARPRTVDDYIASSAAEWKALLQRLRSIVLSAAPEAEEGMRWGRPVYLHNGLLCYLDKARHHVTLGFYQGAALRDRTKLLEGSGGRLRHLKIRAAAELRARPLSHLVKQAVEFNER